MIKQFIALFAKEQIKYICRENRFFSVPEEVIATEKKNGLKSISIGLPLGEMKENTFFPSLPLLSWLANYSEKKVFITDKAAWLFLCGKDISPEHIIKGDDSGLVLVQNKEDENLGYGRVTSKGIKNLLDRGDYLRRERKSSKTA